MTRVLHVHPSSAHVERQLGPLGLVAGAVDRHTTLAQLEGDLARALLSVRVAAAPVVRIVLRRVVEQRPAVRAAARTVPLDALADALETTLRSLRRGGVDAPQLRRAAERCARPGDRARALLWAEVLLAVDAALAGLELVDPASVPLRLSEALADRALDPARVVGALGDAHLVVHDPVGVFPARLAWLEALHAVLVRSGGGVSVVLPTAPTALLGGVGLDDPRERLAARLEERWQRLEAAGRPVPTLLHRPAGVAGAPLAGLVAAAFGSGPRVAPIATAGALLQLDAASVSIAADVAAAEVARALREGVAPHRIVLALPSLDEAIVRPLRRSLSRLGVPVFDPRGAPPRSAPSIARLLELLGAIERGLRKTDLVDLLRATPGLAPLRRRELACTLETKVVGEDLTGAGDAPLSALGDADRALLLPLVRTLLACAAPVGRLEMLRRLVAVAERIGVGRTLGRGELTDLVRRDDPALIDAAAADVAAHRAFANALDDLARAARLAGAADAPITLREQVRELELALDARSTVPGSRSGAVVIARLRDRIGLDADVLILLETHDGALPSRPAPDPLLTTGVLDALRALDPLRAPLPRGATAAIDLLAALDALGSARRNAVLVQRVVDDDGRAQLPGALTVELQRVGAIEVRRERGRVFPGPDAPPRRPGDLELGRHRAAARALGDETSLPPGVEPSAAARARAEIVRRTAFAQAALGGALLGPVTGALALDDAGRARLRLRLRGDEHAAASASAIDVALGCPFASFADTVLRARRADPLDADGGARKAGDAAHAALCAIHRSLRDVPLVAGETLESRARRIAIETIAPNGASAVLLRLRRQRVVEQVVALVLADDADMRETGRRFRDAEVAFGPGEPWPTLVLGGGDDAVHVRGRIDRWDETPHGALVIDYKSSVPDSVGPRYVETGSVQLPLYARVVAAAAQPPPRRVDARIFGYRRAQLGGHLGWNRKDDGAWRAQVGDAGGGEGQGALARRVIDAFGRMRDGAVPPVRGRQCEHCTFRPACRAPEVVLEGGPE